jgi:hypothetical protein
MIKFSRQLFIQYNTQLTEALTISRLSLNIFMKEYLRDSKLPVINKANIFNFIKLGYYGGQTEVYIPYGENLKYVDVNSLYPFAALKPMPGANCKYIESITEEGLDLDNLFGFFYALVESPADIYLGLLPIRNEKGLIFPRGKFKGI